MQASLHFIGVAAGAYSRQGDAGIFRESAMEHHLYEGHVHISPTRPKPCTAESSNHLYGGLDFWTG